MSDAPVTLRVGLLIDGLGGSPITDAAIAIKRDRIAWVGPFNALTPEWSPNVLDYTMATALPGLVDAHVHMSLFADGRSYEAMAGDSDRLMALAAARNARAHLLSGVTTARDNGARNHLGFDIRLAIERGYFEGPRLLVAGRPITCTGGHFGWCGEEADGEEAIREAVRRLVAEGADHIKLMASGGGTVGTDPTKASYTVAELTSARAASHELGRLVTAHCRARESMDRAIEAGLDCIEHGEFLDADGVPRFDAGTAQRMAEAGTYLSPTLAAYGWHTVVRLRARQNAGSLGAEDAATLQGAEDRVLHRLECVNRLLELGMEDHIVAGSDAGCFDFSFGHLDYDLSLLVQAGMSPMQAIMAGTRFSARACGVGGLVGTLEAGKYADVLLVDGDPTVDIGAISSVRAVFKAGVLVHDNAT
ncbi:MAG: amidohydrolase family protein [Chloroflexota bacterium]|nr:amidohydrolase family protein [Chloroflexota bacterium]